MKQLIATALAAVLVFSFAGGASAKKYNPSHGPTHKVSGYTKKNGTHVAPHQRTQANSTKSDNLYIK
jgi:hypothetical protein